MYILKTIVGHEESERLPETVRNFLKEIKEKPAFAGNFLGEYVTNRPGPL